MNPSVTIRGRSRPAHWRRLERERRVAENGDSFLVGETLVQPPVLEGRGFYFGAVADGLGGEGHDDLASQAAVRAMERIFLGQQPVQLVEPVTPDALLREAYVYANRSVCDERTERGVEGMFTTLTAALITDDQQGERVLYPGNIGDSRMYLFRQKQLSLLSRDDGESGYVTRVIGDPNVFQTSFLQTSTILSRTPEVQRELRTILQDRLISLVPGMLPASREELTALFHGVLEGSYPLEYLHMLSHELSALLDALGMERFYALLGPMAETYEQAARVLAPVTLRSGDRLLLCTDGISNAFSAPFIADALSAQSSSVPMEETLDNILIFLLEAPGRVDDDRTGVLIHIH